MANRKRYHLTTADKGWEVKEENSNRVLIQGDTKEETLEKAIRLARDNEPSSLVIHKADGTIEEERTYPRGSDPHPPKG